MSRKPPLRSGNNHFVAGPNDKAELERMTAEYRRLKHTAAYQVGTCPVIDAPLPLLAQFVAELPGDDRRAFLAELAARLPADALGPLADALQARLGAA